MVRRQYKIVLADHTEFGQQLENALLQRSLFSVSVAHDGPQALELTVSDPPALLIVDQEIEGLCGTEICARLRGEDRARKVPVLVLADAETEELKQSCSLAGASALVARSAGRDALLHVVGQILGIPPRRPVRLTVFFSVLEGDSEKETLGKAVNLGEGGMGMEVNRPYEPGSTFKLRFVVPGDPKKIQAGAIVRWVRSGHESTFSVGVEFTEMAEEDRKRLVEFLDKTLSAPVSPASGAPVKPLAK